MPPPAAPPAAPPEASAPPPPEIPPPEIPPPEIPPPGDDAPPAYESSHEEDGQANALQFNGQAMADHDGAPHPASDLADSEFEPALLAVLVSPVARAAADAQTPTSPSAALLSPQLSNANAESPDEILMAQDNPLTSDLDEPNAAELSEVDPVQADAGGFSTDLTERSARELLQPGNGF